MDKEIDSDEVADLRIQVAALSAEVEQLKRLALAQAEERMLLRSRLRDVDVVEQNGELS